MFYTLTLLIDFVAYLLIVLVVQHLFAYCTACAVSQPRQLEVSPAERELAQAAADAVQELSMSGELKYEKPVMHKFGLAYLGK